MPTNTDERPRVYLNKVHLKGYKSIEDVTIDFQKGLNILIGKNGAGKSNLLELINDVIEFKRDENISFKSSILDFKSNDDHSFVFEIGREVNFKPNRDNLLDKVRWSEKISIDGEIKFDSSDGYGPRRFTHNGKKVVYNNIPVLFGRIGYQYLFPLYLKYNLPLTLDSIDIPAVIKVEIDDDYYIWHYPRTLNSIYNTFFNLEMKYESKFNGNLDDVSASDIIETLEISENIIFNLRLFTPIEDVKFNNNINIYKEDKSFIIDSLKLEFKVNGNWYPWSQLSDGTRRLFYIVAEITHSNGLILLEEPELGVHPHQFHLLMNFLKEQSVNKQIIISTHAPKALDHLNLDELNNILLVNYDQKNGTQLRHLTDEEQTKAQEYAKEVGYVSDYWMYSDLEE